MDQEEFDMMPEKQAEEEELDPDNPDHAFAILKKNYNKILMELEDNLALANYAEELTKLFDCACESRDKYIQLEEENTQLKDELCVTKEKLSNEQVITTESLATIEELNTKIVDAHKMVDNAHEREQSTQEIIDNLREQINILKEEINYNEKTTMTVSGDGIEANKKEALERDKQRLTGEVTKLKLTLNQVQDYQECLEQRASEANLQIMDLTQEIEEGSKKYLRVSNQKTKLLNDLVNLRDCLRSKDEELEKLRLKLSATQDTLVGNTKECKEQSVKASESLKKLEIQNKHFVKLQEQYNRVVNEVKEFRNDNDNLKKTLGCKEDELHRLKVDLEQFQKQCDCKSQKLLWLEKENQDGKLEIEKKCKIIEELNSQIKQLVIKVEDDKKVISECKLREDNIKQQFLQYKKSGINTKEQNMLEDKTRKAIEEKFNRYSHTNEVQLKELEKLKHKLNLVNEVVVTKQQKIDGLLRELQQNKKQSTEDRDVITDRDNKLITKGYDLDAMEIKQQLLQKSIKELNIDNASLREVVFAEKQQIQQLKDDLLKKDHLILKEKTDFRAVQRERDGIKIALNDLQQEDVKVKKQLCEMKTTETRLRRNIAEGDKKIKEQDKVIKLLHNERDLLGNQLLHRNDEITLLYEKVKLLQMALQCGVTQYQQRLDDIKLMRIEIQRLRQEKGQLNKIVQSMTDFKQEVFHLERDLTRERIKNKALESDARNPLNIHRWRRLEGSDPDAYQLLQKIIMLQKQVLKQSDTLQERDRQLKETQKLYMQLRRFVQHQPGNQQTIDNIRFKLAATAKTTKTLIVEMEMLEHQKKLSNGQLMKTNMELCATKRELLLERRKRAKNQDTLKMIQTKMAEAQTSTTSAGLVRYTGGGFRMAVRAVSAKPSSFHQSV